MQRRKTVVNISLFLIIFIVIGLVCYIISSKLIYDFIGSSLSSCDNKKNEAKKKDKYYIDTFQYEIRRNESTIPNELSYHFIFNIDFSVNQQEGENDLVVRIATVEKSLQDKKSFHFVVDYCNTENVTLSSTTERYPYALLNYKAETSTLNVNAQIKIITNDLIDDINNFIKIDCYGESSELIDDNSFLNDGAFIINYSDDSLIHYEFDEFSESYKIVSVLVLSDTFTIPADYKGHPVRIIGKNAFYDYKNLKNVIIPDSITSIESSAFENCSSLTNITIPDNVTSIGENAFKGCVNIQCATIPALAIPFIPKDNLTEVVITSGTTIGKSAFADCSNLTNITIPNSITSIGEYAFYNCNNLNYNLSNNGYYLGNEENPYVLLVKSISTGIRKFTINSNTKFIYQSAFSNCSSLTSITIPNNVISIGSSAFSGCKGLTSITIPDNVTSIGEYAFLECNSLTSISLPFVGASLNETANTHFGYIFGASEYTYNSVYVPSSLKEVVITSSNSIGPLSFFECSNLTSITILGSITRISESAFSNCTGLEEVYYKGTATEWKDITNNINITSATIYYYSETKPTEGNCWHYVDGVITKW